jgi:hypothetical protein
VHRVAVLSVLSASREGEDLGRCYREHEDLKALVLILVKGAVAHLEPEPSVPPGGPHLGEAGEHVIVGDPDGIALHHDVKRAVPAVAAGCHGDEVNRVDEGPQRSRPDCS